MILHRSRKAYEVFSRAAERVKPLWYKGLQDLAPRYISRCRELVSNDLPTESRSSLQTVTYSSTLELPGFRVLDRVELAHGRLTHEFSSGLQ